MDDDRIFAGVAKKRNEIRLRYASLISPLPANGAE